MAYEGRYRSDETDVSAAVVGLGCDTNPARSWAVLDLEAARSRLDGWRKEGLPRLLPVRTKQGQ